MLLVKQFVSGMFIAIVMTGLDQDMMQKNLTCRNLKDAQKNMFWFTIVLTIVNLIFLGLGLLLTIYAEQNGIDAHKDPKSRAGKAPKLLIITLHQWKDRQAQVRIKPTKPL